MIFSIRPLHLALVAVLMTALPAAAQQQDPKEILDGASKHLADQSRFGVTAEVTYRGNFGSDSEELVTDYDIAVDRPGNASVHVENAEIDLTMYTDGTRMIRYIPMFDQYVDEEQEVSPALLIRSGGFSVLEPLVNVLAEIAEPEPFAAVKNTAEFFGLEPVDGVTAHKIGVQYANRAFVLWIDAGTTPDLLKIAADMTDVEEQMKANTGGDADIEVVAMLNGWTADVADDRIMFSPPEGVEQVAAFQPPRPASPADALIGKTAPDFELRLLDGGILSLSAKKDKEIVILDFWATWCGPCRAAMPIMEKVSGEFADQDVRLYAVNLEEEIEDIKSFLESQGLNVQVALDTDGSVAEMYKAFSIPQTVIVGKDGTVQAVHVGMSPNLETELREELTQLVGGKNLTD